MELILLIIVIVLVVKWAEKKPRAGVTPPLEPGAPNLKMVADDIRARAHKYDGKVREELLAVADSLEAPPSLVADSDAATQRFEPGAPAATHVHAVAAEAPPSPAQPHWTSIDLNDALHSLDNINLLLFLGAFLIVVSAGIFVGYNFETLTGVFKTAFLALFTAAFYFTGLLLYLNAPRMRPAGSTFTGIGLVLMPLVGLAAYNFTSLHSHAHVVWFVTSLVTLAAYIVTLAATRQTYIAYLMAFTTLSLFESGISLIQLPIYWYGWGMGVVSLLLLSLSRWSGWWEDAAQSLSISANVFIPISLIFSLALAPEHGLTQLGVTVGLAGLFYAVLAQRNLSTQAGEVYWLGALVSLPAALGVGLWDWLPHGAVAAILVAVAAGYLLLGFTTTKLPPRWQVILGSVTAFLPLAAAAIEFDRPWALLGCLSAASAAGALYAWRLRQSGLALLAILSTLALPLVLLRDVLDPAAGWGLVALAYLLLAPVLYLWRRRMRGWPQSGDMVGAAGYLMSLSAAIVSAAASGATALLLTGLAAAVVLYGISYLERRPELVYLAVGSSYLAIAQLVTLAHWYSGAYAIILLLAGAVFYGLGLVVTDLGSAEALRYSGLAGPYLGAVTGLTGDEGLAPTFSLATGAVLLYAEGVRRQFSALKEVAAAVLLVAFDWFLAVEQISTLQLYTIPWAGYFVFLGARRSDDKSAYDLLNVIALGVLTLPIAGQALGENGQLYGLELIFIGLGLAILGSTVRYKLVMWWGAGTLIAEVLYQMRDFLYALPKYVISAALGLALLATAIVLLGRRRDH